MYYRRLWWFCQDTTPGIYRLNRRIMFIDSWLYLAISNEFCSLHSGPPFSVSVNFRPCYLVRHFPGPSFSALATWSVISKFVNFRPCYLVRHFLGPSFSGLAIWSVIFLSCYFRSCIFSYPAVSKHVFDVLWLLLMGRPISRAAVTWWLLHRYLWTSIAGALFLSEKVFRALCLR